MLRAGYRTPRRRGSSAPLMDHTALTPQEALEQIPALTNRLGEPERAALLQQCSVETLGSNVVILEQGAKPPEHLWLVLQGLVSLYQRRPEGRKVAFKTRFAARSESFSLLRAAAGTHSAPTCLSAINAQRWWARNGHRVRERDACGSGRPRSGPRRAFVLPTSPPASLRGHCDSCGASNPPAQRATPTSNTGGVRRTRGSLQPRFGDVHGSAKSYVLALRVPPPRSR